MRWTKFEMMMAQSSNNTSQHGSQPAMSPCRVLIVAPSFDILGGQSVQAARLFSRLRETNSLEVGFLPINPRLPGLLHKLQALKYVRTVVTSIAYLSLLLTQVRKFDVIHVFSASYLSFLIAPTPAILVAKIFRKKILLNYHSGEAEDHLSRWPSARWIIRLVDEVVVPSSYLVGIFKQFGISSEAINNVIELNQFKFRHRARLRPVFLCNRNLETHYGVDRVLRAFALVQEQVPNARLTVVGDGKQRADLERLAESLNLRHTAFVGRVEPDLIREHYDAADIYLNGSEIDNQPLSILEAFACGLPLVTTDAGGIPDMVKHEVTGMLVGRGNHEAMATCALRLLADEELAGGLSTRGHKECEAYKWNRLKELWLSAYAKLHRSSIRQHEETPSRRRIGFDEIRTRGVQALNAWLERIGWSKQVSLLTDKAFFYLLNRDETSKSFPDLLDKFRTAGQSAFFAGFANRRDTTGVITNRWPDTTQAIVERANRIIDGRFDLLGYNDLSFGDPIDWHVEPVSGKATPQCHWSRINFLDAELVGDKKIIWELNRHQYFVTLGRAYWLTNDERFAETFVDHIKSWCEQNPPKQGINWASSLEVSFRSISWLWGLHFFKDSPALTTEIFGLILKTLYRNARHLETYLSTYFSPNTHLTGEALGLYYLGNVLREFEAANRWRVAGRKILLEQLGHHVRPDGVYFEQTTYYHRYTADFYTHFLLLARANNDPLDENVERKLTALLDHLMYITRPDGSSPLLGDDDGGRLLMIDARPANDFRATLSNGAVIFRRPDYKFVSSELAEETIWLLGPEGAATFDRLRPAEPLEQSKAFPAGGYFVMRDGWNHDANYLVFDCGPHGFGNGGHAHADALALEVVSRGQTALVDPGTYTYTGSSSLRDWFRSSQAHNTLTIDNESSSVSTGPFSWQAKANCDLKSWVSHDRFDFVEGQHDGYQRLNHPATHERSILFMKNDYWIVRDRLRSEGAHKVDMRFHVAAVETRPLQLEPQKDGFSLQDRGKHVLELRFFGKSGTWSREEGWISNCYGKRAPAPVGVFSANFAGNDEVLTLLTPVSRDAREVEAIGGCAFAIESESGTDLVMVRRHQEKVMETVRLRSDFSWTWARFSPAKPHESSQLIELLVLDGQKVELDGKEILKSTRRLNYLHAKRVGEKFRLQTHDGVLELTLPVGDLESVLEELKTTKATLREPLEID